MPIFLATFRAAFLAFLTALSAALRRLIALLEALSAALVEKTEFTEAEWEAFGIEELRPDHYVLSEDKVNGTDVYFKPQPPMMVTGYVRPQRGPQGAGGGVAGMREAEERAKKEAEEQVPADARHAG